MWWNHGWGWGWPVVMAVAMVACMAMMTGMMRHGSWRRMWPPGMWPPGSRSEEEGGTPERILARRLARGEIGVEEFQRRRDGLQHASNSTADSNATAGTARPGHAERHLPP